MPEEILNYKGYQIIAKPMSEGESLWFGGYEILKDGQQVSNRTHLYPANPYFKGAYTDSIEQAKTEIDNLTPRMVTKMP